MKSDLFPCLLVYSSVAVLKQLDQRTQQVDVGSTTWYTSAIFKHVPSVGCFWKPQCNLYWWKSINSAWLADITSSQQPAHTPGVNFAHIGFYLKKTQILFYFAWVTHSFFKQTSTPLPCFAVKSSWEQKATVSWRRCKYVDAKRSRTVQSFLHAGECHVSLHINNVCIYA